MGSIFYLTTVSCHFQPALRPTCGLSAEWVGLNRPTWQQQLIVFSYNTGHTYRLAFVFSFSYAIQTIFIRAVNTTRSFKFSSQSPKHIKKKLNNSPTLRLQFSIKRQELKSLVSAMFVLIHTSTLPAHCMTTKKERTNERKNERNTNKELIRIEQDRR